MPDFASTKLTLSTRKSHASILPWGVQYLAGVWQVNIHPQLVWRSLVDKYMCRQSSPYTAPSFSWAARTGDVIFSRKCNIYRACFIIVDFVKHIEMMLLGELHAATSIQMGKWSPERLNSLSIYFIFVLAKLPT